jgi:peptidoglycan L-alanyl-D-glutamate endopeptidase CwlK
MALLKVGSSGATVMTLQKDLVRLGFKPGKADGRFGPRTEAAVTAFQKTNRLTADGIVGPKTSVTIEKKLKELLPAKVKRDVLEEGSSGIRVQRLQQGLKKLGLDPGKADGKFGAQTKRAVMAFQESVKLKPDGIVGPKTLAALNVAPIPKPKKRLRSIKVPVDVVAKLFPKVPLKNIEENLPYVLKELKRVKLDDRDMILMALATIRAETGNFTPLSEFKSKYNTAPGGKSFALYDYRTDLGNTGPPDGMNFRGRGYIQLTGRTNYELHGQNIGLDKQLVDNPQLANEPEIAAKLLASFLKSKEAEIRDALTAGDLRLARKLVNGGSHGLAEFRQTFKAGEQLL